MGAHRFIVGHVLDALRLLPDESVHCVVTSPPYWGLRDYGLPPVAWPEVEYSPMPGVPPLRVPAWTGQLGLEPVPEMYVGHLVLVFREVRRVLRRDGTLWLVIGDSYASPGKGGPWDEGRVQKGTGRTLYARQSNRGQFFGLKPKDLVGVPWRAVFALQADRWFLRSDVIWLKTNCLPESVKDRCTNAHEYVFMLTKSSQYFYDAEAVKEPAVTHLYDRRYLPGAPPREREGEPWNLHGPLKPHRGFRVLDTTCGRNRRSVWEIPLEPFPGSHFAVFPRRLAELCILAATSPKACPTCGAPWRRVVEKERESGHPAQPQEHLPEWGRRESGARGNRLADVGRFSGTVRNTYWQPTCRCSDNDGSGRCVVLDPFGGAGTTTLAAMTLGRDSVYIDLKREYTEMALDRCGLREGRQARLFCPEEWLLEEVPPAAGPRREKVGGAAE